MLLVKRLPVNILLLSKTGTGLPYRIISAEYNSYLKYHEEILGITPDMAFCYLLFYCFAE